MNMNKGSMIEVAIKTLTDAKKALPFAELWAKVKAELEITEAEEMDRIGRFYTDLSLSGATVVLGGNVWDLAERHTYEQKHTDVSDIYSEIDEKDEDEIEAQEEKEYDQAMVGSATSSDDEEDFDSDDDSERPSRKDDFDAE